MVLVRKRHLYNQSRGDSLHLIGMVKAERQDRA
jgi:hypothetical protein